MHLRSSAPLLLLLLPLCLMGRVLEVNGQEGGYLQEALKALDLTPGLEVQPQLQRNKTGVLISKLLQAVHCAERTGNSQDICDRVRPPLVFKCHCIMLNFYIQNPESLLCIQPVLVYLFHEMYLLWVECE